MTGTFSFTAGDTPLLVSIPHDGRQLPGEIARSTGDLTSQLFATTQQAHEHAFRGRPAAAEQAYRHVRQLYGFASELGASLICAEYSRYVVDLNRPADDAELYEGRFGTGLCPVRTFAGEDIYEAEATIAVAARTREFWQPYHDHIAGTLARLRERYQAKEDKVGADQR